MSFFAKAGPNEDSYKWLYKRLCISYAIAAVLWLLALDWALALAIQDPALLDWIIPVKNVIFITFSALGLWDYVQKHFKRQRAAERKVSMMQERLRLLSQASSDGIWIAVANASGDIEKLEYANPCFTTIWGRSAEEWESSSESFWDWIHEEDRAWAKPRMKAFLQGKGPRSLDIEFKVVQEKGGSRTIWTKAELLSKSGELPTRVAGVSRDLSIRMKKEEALLESERMFKSLFNGSRDAIVLCSLDGKFIEVNDAFLDLTGYEAKELRGMDFQSLTRREWKPKEQRIITEQVVERGFSDLYEKECRKKDGSYIPVNVRMSVFNNADGMPAGMFGIVRDTTQEKRQFRDVLQAKEDAIMVSESQNRFLRIVSHELRTPLNPIIGYADLLLSRYEDPLQQDFLNIIKESATGMVRTIGDILEYADVDSGDCEIEETPFRIAELLDAIVKEAGHAAATNGNDIEAIYEWKNCAVRGDPRKISQILSNLVTNACKFTRNGIIRVSCNLLEGWGDDAVFRFAVEDNGIGIHESQLRDIFEPFKRAGETPSYGIGLGLALCRRLTTVLEGKISVESTVGVGSTFYLDIPMPIETMDAAELVAGSFGETRQFSEGSRVLVVEDDMANRIFASDLLNHFGCDVETALNGEESLDALSKEEFDLVLMDLSMPVMDGIEATTRLRKSKGINRNVPVVAMTAHANKQVQSDCRRIGMNDFIAKPVTISSFEDLLQRWLSKEK